MSPTQRFAITWLTPLLLVASAGIIIATGHAPHWLELAAIIPCLPIAVLIMFSNVGDWAIIAAIAFSCIVWYSFGVAFIASSFRRLAKEPLPTWEKVSIVVFLLLACVFAFTYVSLKGARLPFGG